MSHVAEFAALGLAMYAGHHAGDYWGQTDWQALNKGKAGAEGVRACLWHVVSYLFVQLACVTLMALGTGINLSTPGLLLGFTVSGVTHYLADRREHGIMLKLARAMGMNQFLKLGVPRHGVQIEIMDDCSSCAGSGTSGDVETNGKCWDCQGGGKLPYWIGDNPSLGTGGWALDQAWHIFFGVFVAALLMAGVA